MRKIVVSITWAFLIGLSANAQKDTTRNHANLFSSGLHADRRISMSFDTLKFNKVEVWHLGKKVAHIDTASQLIVKDSLGTINALFKSLMPKAQYTTGANH